jgi:glyoxylase-like metal-dependent hydrolase (beta-lactamase superfamily II)
LSKKRSINDGNHVFNAIMLDAHNPSPMTGAGNHTYLLIEEHGSALLIDAGVGESRHLEELAATLEDHHAQLRDVLVTHAHPDHASGVTAIARDHRGARFFKYPWPDEDRRYAVEWQPIHEGDCVTVGDHTLVALHTPGHSPDHTAFWHEDSRTVFTGDLVVQGSSVMIHATRGGDLGQYLESLQRLLTLAPARLLPAHGPDVTNPESLLRSYIEHRRMREAQVIAALAAGRDAVPAIVESIYDGLSPALVPAATENVQAHLEKLRREGRAIEQNGRWTISASRQS